MKKLLFFVTEDWYFVTHRLDLAVAAKRAGYDVSIVTQVSEHEQIIRDSGLNLIPITLSRRSLNPISELRLLKTLYNIYRKEAPDIVHNVTFKPVIYGSVVAWLLGIGKTVNALAGLGFLFRSQNIKAKVLKFLVRQVLKVLFRHKLNQLILQNPDDVHAIESLGVKPEKIHLIRGAGVNTAQFSPQPEQDKPEQHKLFTVLIATRMLWDKGVGEFVEAARLLRQTGAACRFVLVGNGDEENPNSITDAQLQAWHDSGVVEWWGKRADMPYVLNCADVVCLPSNYGEGIPKVLIEAAATAKPIVTTDTPGCREIVIDQQNGLLVPVENPKALAGALETLYRNPELCQKMGKTGRQMVIEQFSLESVVKQTLAVYALS